MKIYSRSKCDARTLVECVRESATTTRTTASETRNRVSD